MKQPFATGHTKTHTFTVTESDLATFDSGPVHAVCATFTLAKHIEWASRLFVLDKREAHSMCLAFVCIRYD